MFRPLVDSLLRIAPVRSPSNWRTRICSAGNSCLLFCLMLWSAGVTAVGNAQAQQSTTTRQSATIQQSATTRQSTTAQRTATKPSGGAVVDSLEAASWLPDSVVAVVRFEKLGELWTSLEQTGAWQTVASAPQLAQLQATPQYRQWTTGRLFIEGLFEQDLPSLVQEATAGPGIAALDRDGGLAVIFHPAEDTFQRTQKVLSEFATLAGLSREGPPGLRAVAYQGVPAFAADELRIAFHQGRVVLASSSALGKAILDRALAAQPQQNLAQQAWYRAAESALAAAGLSDLRVHGAIDLEALRQAGKLQMERGKDLGQELILGGVFEVISQSPWATFGGDFAGGQLAVRFAAPLPQSLDPRWDYFFGSADADGKGRGSVPASFEFAEQILSVRWHRDLGAFWNMAPQLISDENAQAGMAKAESDIATLLGGVTTVGEVFGFLDPQFDLVVCQPRESIRAAQAEIKIPTFALVGKMRDRAKGERVLRLAFQQLISFANLNAGPGGYPPMEVLTERVDGDTFCVAEYMQLSDRQDSRDYMAAGLYRNFSPTLAISDERLVIASDRGLAEQILAAPPSTRSTSDGALAGGTNSIIEIRPPQAAALGQMNRDALIAQRMLQTGRERTEVAAEIDLFLAIADRIDYAALRLGVDATYVTLDGVLRLATKSPTADPAK